jgi:hypothetical protein
MAYNLIPFPGTACPAVKSITVDVKRSGTNLRLVYKLEGDIAALKIPTRAAAVPTEKLWEHTCFELFFVEPGEDAYQEYNFAPSTAWDHYHFSDYRELMRGDKAGAKVRPAIATTQTATGLQMVVDVILPTDDVLDAALAAVIEDANGKLTYWALKHTTDEPDFHDSGAFMVEL